MLLRRASLENVRSFLERAELRLDGNVCIVIGPNGGGKTNLLDAIVTVLRRFILATQYPYAAPTPENPQRHEIRWNDALGNMVLKRHSAGKDLPQRIELDLEVTESDVANMVEIKSTTKELGEKLNGKYINYTFDFASKWTLEGIHKGAIFTYTLLNESLQVPDQNGAREFYQYLQHFEIIKYFRQECDYSELSTPMLYLPVTRATGALSTEVQLHSFDEIAQKRSNDAILSQTGSAIASLPVGKIADKFHMLLPLDNGKAKEDFLNDPNIKEMTRILGSLGYEWELVSVDFKKSHYDIRLKKQGISFLASSASSGERELLTYVLVIFGLNVRNALIVVDEPELHLHPQWQKILLSLFISLSESTGNQFLLATHSPTFISPASIQFVSRVFIKAQRSSIQGLDKKVLPEAKHVLNIVNSQNNEKMFFADKVVLVEGLSDRIFFEKLIAMRGKGSTSSAIIEVVDVGGKGLFKAYVKLLNACNVNYSIIADLDYIDKIGTPDIKALLKVSAKKIKNNVIEDVGSKDADALVDSIDKAIESKDWKGAEEVWEYIKANRLKRRTDLKDDEKQLLAKFILDKREEHIFLFSKGDLEDYLPDGLKKKDIEKLIVFLNEPDYWDKISGDSQSELNEIVAAILADNKA